MMAASWGGCLLVCESCWLWPSVATHDGSILGFVFSVSKPQDSESGWLWQRVGCGSNSPAVAVEDAIVELDHLAADDRRPADDDQRVLTAAGQRSSAKTRPADPALPCALPCALRRRRRLSLYASSLRGLSLCDGVHVCASARTTCTPLPLRAGRWWQRAHKHFADAPSPSHIETPTKGRGGCSALTNMVEPTTVPTPTGSWVMKTPTEATKSSGEEVPAAAADSAPSQAGRVARDVSRTSSGGQRVGQRCAWGG